MTPSLPQQLPWELLSLYTHRDAGPERESRAAFASLPLPSFGSERPSSLPLGLCLSLFFPGLSVQFGIATIHTHEKTSQLFSVFHDVAALKGWFLKIILQCGVSLRALSGVFQKVIFKLPLLCCQCGEVWSNIQHYSLLLMHFYSFILINPFP